MVYYRCEMKTQHCKRKELPECRLTYKVIFLFLALSTLIFLLLNIITQKIRFKSHSTSIVPESSPPHHHDISPWSCQGQSPEDALEERSLIESIDWPEPLHFPKAPPFKQTSDPAHSHFTILPAEGGREWHVGDQLNALVQMYDFQGQPKHYGGDFLLARLHNLSLEAGVAGQVVDHLNGSYSAVFPLLWEGRAQVEVTLVHPSEAVTVLRRLTREQPDRVFFKSVFRSGLVTETTVCNVCLPPSQQTLCNYTNLNTREPWYCYKPNKLSCDNRINHAMGGFKQNITSYEQTLFKSGINMKVSVKAFGSDSVSVLAKEKDKPKVKNNGETAGPSGYYYRGRWRAISGITVHQFSDASAISQCLRDKTVLIYGDSTARQWFEFLTTSLPDLKEFNLHSLKQNGPFMSVDTSRNILVKYRCHGPPIRFSAVPISQLRYIANELDGLAGGPDTVVLLSIWSHFGTFPVEVYIHRLRGIRRSVARLLDRAPRTLVVVRTANLKALMSLYETLTNSDWYSLQRDRVLRAMFKGLNVVLLDAWGMTLAHHLPHSLHPQPPIIKNMIDVVLSNICPQRIV